MGSAPVLHFDPLLAPIPGDDPAGIDLREPDDSVYWPMRAAASEARDIERKVLEQPGNDQYSLEQCRWPEIAEMAQGALAGETKDFEIAACFCEALLRQHGFAGLRDGLRLARRLAEQYWDGLYPRPSDGMIADRLSQFRGLFRGALVVPIQRVAMTEGTEYSRLDYDLATRLETVKDVKDRQARIDRGDLTLQQFEQAVQDSSNKYYEDLLADIELVGAELNQLAELLLGKCQEYPDGEDALESPREVTKALEEYRGVVNSLIGNRLTQTEAEEVPGEGASAAADSGAVGGSGELTRDAALKQLRDLAEFFRKIEPHSPISHHIQEAVHWGSLSLPELLAELIPQENTRKDLFTRIGISDLGQKKG